MSTASFNQNINQVYSSLATGCAILALFLILDRVIKYARSLPESHPASTAGRMLWAFLNTPIVAQTMGYLILFTMFRRIQSPSSSPNAVPTKITVKYDHGELADIVSSAVSRALAESGGANCGVAAR
ncbi:hypothetical protein BBP40_009307 [Aspergillus hancockii]|nr:hypothetical protein BBP40_009307 [Aspergillus hancockii]